MKLPLIKGTKVSKDAEWRDALPVNVQAFIQNINEATGYVRTLDGLKSFATGTGEDRGGIWSDRFKIHVRVSGDRLIQVSQFGGVTDIGAPTVIAGSEQINFDNSFNSIAFVANGDYYRYDPAIPSLTIITKPAGAGNYIDICFIDGYYILTDGESLWATNILDETDVSAIDFAGSDFAPDEIVGIDKSTDNKLIAFNRYTTERFYNDAGPQFPFARIPNAAIPIGIVGTRAKSSIGDGQFVVFGGSKERSPSFYLLTNSYQKISTNEIDSVIDTYSDYELTNMVIEFRDQRSQSLVICHLPNDVLVYDVTYSATAQQPIWYIWKSGDKPWRGINGVYDPRNVDNSASAWIYGDKDDSRIGKLDTTICTQYGEVLEWILTTPLVKIGGTVKKVELLTPAGHGTLNGSVVFISTTKDGVIYPYEEAVDLGNVGEYKTRVIARSLGDYPNLFGLRFRGKSAKVTSLAECEIE